jgi:diguanylate cyclase (GGDEF)-like protein
MGQAEASREAPRDPETAKLRRRNAELEVLYDTIRDLTSTLAVAEVLERLLERTLRHLDAEIGSILLCEDEGGLRIVTARGLPEQVVSGTSMAVGEGISGRVASSGRSLLVEDIERHPEFQRRNHERYYTHSLISAPLALGARVLGVINVNNKSSRAPFGQADVRLLEAIAGHAAVALGNAHRYEDTLRRAQRDALTGLANHGHFFTSLETEIDRARRYKRSLTLAMIDIDHFKQYNDRFGHPAGDQALMRVADAIADRSRSHDVVARYGGEEFAVILPETGLDGAVAFAEKIRGEIQARGVGAEGEEPLTVSIGVAALEEHGASAGELVQSADCELYRAKSLGRDRVCAPS